MLLIIDIIILINKLVCNNNINNLVTKSCHLLISLIHIKRLKQYILPPNDAAIILKH